MTTKVAVVTGSNKGIGFGIVRALCKQYKGDVFLTARNVDYGTKAVADLKGEGLDPKFHQLDITDKSSIETLRTHLLDKYGGLDILVNNAGVAYKKTSTAPFAEQAEVTTRTNFWGTLDACNVLFPILRPAARVVTVSGTSGHVAYNQLGDTFKQRVRNATSITDVEHLMRQFVRDVQEGNHIEKGWPTIAHSVSKLGLIVMTDIQQKMLDADASRPDIVVNACCPGYVDTDLTSHQGSLTIDQGADTPIYLALLPPGVENPRGEFVKEREIQKIC